MRRVIAQNHFKKGVTTLCILSLLDRRSMYGYQLVQAIERISNGKFMMQEGTLYPVLYRLEEQGYIVGEKRQVGRRMVRVYYCLTTEGKAFAKKLRGEYDEISRGVKLVLNCKPEDVIVEDEEE